MPVDHVIGQADRTVVVLVRREAEAAVGVGGDLAMIRLQVRDGQRVGAVHVGGMAQQVGGMQGDSGIFGPRGEGGRPAHHRRIVGAGDSDVQHLGGRCALRVGYLDRDVELLGLAD